MQSGLTLDEACEMERNLIVQYQSNNPNHGYNLTDGGEGISGYHLNDKQLERHRQASLGRKHTQATKDKISKLNKGRKLNLTDEQRKACAERAKKLHHYKRTDEQRQRMSEAYEKRRDRPGHAMPHSEETKRKISEAQRGRKLTDEWKRHMSESQKLRWQKIQQEKLQNGNTKKLF